MPKKCNLAGGNLLKGIARLIQIAKLSEDNNKLILEAVEALKQAVKQSGDDDGQASLQIFNGRFFLREEKLPLLRKDVRIFNHMLKFFEKRSIYGLHFDANLKNTIPKEILTFVRLLYIAKQHAEPAEWLQRELEKNNLHWVVVIQESTLTLRDMSMETKFRQSESLDQKKAVAQKTYHYALNSIKEVADKLLSDKKTGIRKPVRMIQRMVDIIAEDDTTFFALSTIRMYDDYTFTHSLNVALLAMSLGKRIGILRLSIGG